MCQRFLYRIGTGCILARQFVSSGVLYRVAGVYSSPAILLTAGNFDLLISSIFIVGGGLVTFAIDGVDFLRMTSNQQRTELNCLIPAGKSLTCNPADASVAVTINYSKIVTPEG